LRITVVIPGKHVIKDVSAGAPRQYEDGSRTVLEVVFAQVDPSRTVFLRLHGIGDERAAARQKVSCGG